MNTSAELQDANRAYYDDGESQLTDDEFDVIQEFAGGTTSTLTPAPDRTPWPVVDHLVPMPGIPVVARTALELKSLFDRGEIGNRGWVSNKLDGLSIELVYDRVGVLQHAILRGDGIRAEDVRANAKHCRGVLDTVNHGPASIRCELVISDNNLKILNERREADGRKVYKSRRSAVAMVRQLTASINELQLLTAVVVDIHGVSPDDLERVAATMFVGGTKRLLVERHNPCNPVEAWKFRTTLQDSRGSNRYQLDGAVYRDHAGRFVKLKFDSTAAITTVRAVVEQLGRTGVVSPVCKFDPVDILGADVKRASVHNAELVERDLPGLGIGAVVLISRRGDVIPHVERVITPSPEPWRPSGVCPSCGSQTDTEGSISRCSADPGECSGTVIGLMRKFCTEIGVKNLGPGVVSALVEAGVTVPAGLYSLDAAWLSQLVMSGGQRIGDHRAASVISEMDARTSMTLGELLGAIGIPGCAKSVMEAVANKFPDPAQLRMIDEAELSTVSGIGPVRAASIAAYLDTRYSDVIEPLLDVVTIRTAAGPLTGKSFCITLAMATGSRPQVEARIRAAGGSVKSSVGKTLSYLVCNSPNESTDKLSRARGFGVPIISETELITMMGSAAVDEVQPLASDDF